jgi:8-oxo-dGTP diphosphatase
MQTVDVAIGVIQRGAHVLLSQRSASVKQPFYWEFPGGKVEAEESPADALRRECREETGITVLASEPLVSVWHDYCDYSVLLHAFVVTQFESEPRGCEGQPLRWVQWNTLSDWNFPAANDAVISALEAWYSVCAG